MKMRAIKKIVDVKPFQLTLLYDNGELLTLDLEEKLKKWAESPQSIYRQLLDPEYFISVKLSSQWKTIY